MVWIRSPYVLDSFPYDLDSFPIWIGKLSYEFYDPLKSDTVIFHVFMLFFHFFPCILSFFGYIYMVPIIGV